MKLASNMSPCIVSDRLHSALSSPSVTVHHCLLPSIAVCHCPLLFIAVHRCPSLSIAVLCCPLLSFAVLHCPLLSVAACHCPSLPVTVRRCLSLSVAACHCPLLPVAARCCPLLPIAAHCCPLLSVTTHCCLSLPVAACHCLSLSIAARHCPSLSIAACHCPSLFVTIHHYHWHVMHHIRDKQCLVQLHKSFSVVVSFIYLRQLEHLSEVHNEFHERTTASRHAHHLTSLYCSHSLDHSLPSNHSDGWPTCSTFQVCETNQGHSLRAAPSTIPMSLLADSHPPCNVHRAAMENPRGYE